MSDARTLLAAKLSQWTGLDLDRGGRTQQLGHLLAQRVSAQGASSADAYVAALHGPEDPEVQRLLEVVTVGHTWFFRDEQLMSVVGDIVKEARANRFLQVWVSACSTGEEAYTLAMMGFAAGVDLQVLATDINSDSLDQARQASYSDWSVRRLPVELREFVRPAGAGRISVDERVRARVRFQRHNLLDAPPRLPGGGGWPLILCRNVLIYFTRPQAASTVERLTGALAAGGWLFLGGAEVVQAAPPGFELAEVGSRHGLRRAPSQASGAIRLAPASPPGPVQVLRPLVPEPPMRVASMLEHALAKVDAGLPDDAIPLCAQALQQDPLSPDAHLVSGMAFHMSGDSVAALQALRAALLLEPDLWMASYYLALSYERLGRGQEARREYRHVVEATRSPRPRPTLAKLDAYRDDIVAMARAKVR